MLATISFKNVDHNDDDDDSNDDSDDEMSTLKDLSRAKQMAILKDVWPQKTIIINPPILDLNLNSAGDHNKYHPWLRRKRRFLCTN